MQQDVVTAADHYDRAGDLAAVYRVVRGFVDSGKLQRSGNVTGWSEGGRGKREQRKQRYAGHTSYEHHTILAAQTDGTQSVLRNFAAARPLAARQSRRAHRGAAARAPRGGRGLRVSRSARETTPGALAAGAERRQHTRPRRVHAERPRVSRRALERDRADAQRGAAPEARRRRARARR